jgi:hypothetical protein
MDLEVINWLMEGDAAIKWQVMKYLLNKPKNEVLETRNQMTEAGWALEILKNQDKNGMWDNGLYSPKWTSTTYSMLLLKRIGLIPNEQTSIGCKILFDNGFNEDMGIDFSRSKQRKSSETCITGMILGICSYFKLEDKRIDQILNYLKDQQMSDGGWNCQKIKGATHGSFNTTLLVLEGLLAYRENYEKNIKQINAMEQKAHEFLLLHKLYQSHRTGEIAHNAFVKLSFPPRWKYNILSALDYFQTINHPYDERFTDALTILNNKKQSGKWKGVKSFPHGSSWTTPEEKPYSRWVTLKAMRINQWWKSKND